MRQKVNKILESAFSSEIAKNILDAYQEIQNNYSLRKWKPSELDAGHFVESVRRAIEKELFNNYTPFAKKLANFNDATLQSYERASGDESFRILIPRALKSTYNIRSKRGVGHVGIVSPNEMDATYILYTVKWILSEMVRIKSSLSITETQKLVDEIVERQIELIWKTRLSIKRILEPQMEATKQILVFLLDESPLSKRELMKRVEYKNPTNFIKLLRYLHKKRLIELHVDGICEITPLGACEAEKIVLLARKKIK